MYGIRSPRLYKTILRGFSITGLEEGHIWAVFEISSYSKADGVTLKPTLHCKFLPHENYGHRALRGVCRFSLNHREILCMLWINPVIFTDCGETP